MLRRGQQKGGAIWLSLKIHTDGGGDVGFGGNSGTLAP
jgi:hypothetical protein